MEVFLRQYIHQIQILSHYDSVTEDLYQSHTMQQSPTSAIIVNILRVLGSDENNNTEINCQPKSGSETKQPALLTVIGR